MPVRLPAAALATLALLASPGAAGARATTVPPLVLPGDAAAAGVEADPRSWLIGSRPGPAARRIARRYGARAVGSAQLGALKVARRRARALATALRAHGLLVYAEPNRLARRAQGPPPDPLSPQAGWRDAVVNPATPPPPVSGASPLLALVDSQLDAAHPEFAGGAVATRGERPVTDGHGTATAAIAAAPANGVGILGLWPGMRAVNVALPPQPFSCADAVEQVGRALDAGARVISMSYGSDRPCFQEYAQLQFAVVRGAIPVAAAGNEFAAGNPLEYPASLPHVLTVASLRPDLTASFFSNANAAIDLGAPGENVLTAVPASFDGDGAQDGWQALSGTSFATPIVAAAVTWVRAARPDLEPDQVAQVVRLSSRDVAPAGWDPATGFGLLQVDRALVQRPPPADPTEPNDDMVWVDGRAFGRPDRPVFGGRRGVRLTALLDRYEDPDDLYRIVLPAGGRVRISVRPAYGDADLAVYDRGARSIADARRRLRRSRRRGRRTDAVTVRNATRRARGAFVRVYVDRGARALDARYRLTVRRG
jgi:hypothetical protein